LLFKGDKCLVPSQEEEGVRLVGVEASGHGLDTAKHAATLTKGSPGVLHGSFSYLLQDAEGQVIDPHSISAGWVF
jgi:tryptophan synthase beta chain